MSEENINKMSFKELRNEVQLLRDELAIFKRKYEDMIYNLDSDNFGKSFTIEQNNMKAQVKITADAIKTMVSDTDLQSELEKYSTVTQTANAIQTVVSKGANLENAIKITSLDQATDPTAVYVIQSTDALGNITGEKYYYYNDLLNRWEILSGDSIYTVFNQTASGFELKGNVLIDGSTVITKNLTLSGNVTWAMENSPVLTQYSSDNLNWHSPMESGDMYMQMSFDGGVHWSTPTKVVGTDANITPQTVFNALTNNGDTQGLFSAFYGDGNRLFINAEYIQTGILNADCIDTDNLSATKLYSKGYKNGYYAKICSNVGDFGIFSPSAPSDAYPNNSNCIWGVYYSDVVTGALNFYSHGENYMGYNASDKATYPKGTWDFSSCKNVLGLDSFVSGGNVIAVFG